jgi:hypothetical protein
LPQVGQSATLVFMRWVFSYDIETDLMRYQEIDDGGWMQRQVVIFGPAFDLVAATTKFERLHARRTGQLAEYARIYGDGLAVFERPIIDDDVHCDVTGDDFETVWHRGRTHTAQQPGQP